MATLSPDISQPYSLNRYSIAEDEENPSSEQKVEEEGKTSKSK